MGRKLEHWDMGVTGTVIGCKLRFPQIGNSWGQPSPGSSQGRRSLLLFVAVMGALALAGLAGIAALHLLQ